MPPQPPVKTPPPAKTPTPTPQQRGIAQAQTAIAKAQALPPKVVPLSAAQKDEQALIAAGGVPLANGGYYLDGYIHTPTGTGFTSTKVDNASHLLPDSSSLETDQYLKAGGKMQADGTIWMPAQGGAIDVLGQADNGSWKTVKTYDVHQNRELIAQELFGKSGAQLDQGQRDQVDGVITDSGGLPPSKQQGVNPAQSGDRQYSQPAGPPESLNADNSGDPESNALLQATGVAPPAPKPDKPMPKPEPN